MSFFVVILRALAPLFLLIVLGYGLKRARVLHAAHVPVLNGLVINLTLPALIVLALATAPQMPPVYALLPTALILAQGVTMALAYGLGRALRLARHAQGAVLIVGTFGNTGFLGYPITLSLLPHLFPVAVLLDQFGMTIMMYVSAALVGASFGAGGTNQRDAILRFLRSPIFLSVVAGMAARLIPWPHALLSAGWARALGGVVGQCLTYLGQGTTPIVLLALGVALRPGAALAAPAPVALSCVLKLIVCPAAMAALCHVFGIRGSLFSIGILQATMPPAVTAAVLCAQNEMEGDLAVGIVCICTVLSALTVPLLLAVVH